MSRPRQQNAPAQARFSLDRHRTHRLQHFVAFAIVDPGPDWNRSPHVVYYSMVHLEPVKPCYQRLLLIIQLLPSSEKVVAWSHWTAVPPRILSDEGVLPGAILDLEHEVGGEQLAGVRILQPDLAVDLARHDPKLTRPDLIGLEPLAYADDPRIPPRCSEDRHRPPSPHQTQQNQQTTHLSGISSIEDEPRRGIDSNNGFSFSDCEESIVSSPVIDPIQQTQQLPPGPSLPHPSVELLPEKPLPEKGKLLQAVIKAGPLLQTLLLAGPLPQ
ncbi:hypothetical protein ACFX2I_021850 [Malus domestica]